MIWQEKLPPQHVGGPINRVRGILWDVLNRLPYVEAMQSYAMELMNLTMAMVQRENEDNAITCVKTIFDLHKVCIFAPGVSRAGLISCQSPHYSAIEHTRA